MAKERDLDNIFNEYDAFLASMGLGGAKQKETPKSSTFGKKVVEFNQLATELDKSSFI